MIYDTQVLNRWLSATCQIQSDRNIAKTIGTNKSTAHALAVSIANALIDVGGLMPDTDNRTTDNNTDKHEECLQRHALAIAKQSHANQVSATDLRCLLQGLQISLLTECTLLSVERPPELTPHGSTQPALLDTVLNRTNPLVVACQMQLKHISSSTESQRHLQGKSLQHEIRTPLQGALLNVELLLEDISTGQPASLVDVHAIKKSVESAIEIVNEFAGRSAKAP